MSKKNRWVADGSRRAVETRHRWMGLVEQMRVRVHKPATAEIWAPEVETCSRDELRARHDRHLAALSPFLYENSGFYRRRFDRLGLTPSDVASVDELARWPVVTRDEMVEDAAESRPFGTYHTMTKAVWERRGWMQFVTSGWAGTRRVFRYTQWDRHGWAWVNARALHGMGLTKADTVFMSANFGPTAWVWGIQQALEAMAIPTIPGGGLDVPARVQMLVRFRPSVLVATSSHLLRLGRAFSDGGIEPALSGVRLLVVSGEPALAVPETKACLEDLWNAPVAELYTSTEASPHAGGYTCVAGSMHLADDIQIWEIVDSRSFCPAGAGRLGATVCTNLISESSPQLRFLVGDLATFDGGDCPCGRTHRTLKGGVLGRADSVVHAGGVSFLPARVAQAVRSLPGAIDEYEVVLATGPDGRDILTVSVEAGPHDVVEALAERIRSFIGLDRAGTDDPELIIELDVDVQRVERGYLPRPEPVSGRFIDLREKVADRA